jgi:hypothetical protein
MLGLVAEGGPLTLRNQVTSHRQFRRAGATFSGGTARSAYYRLSASTIPLFARSSKGLTGWVTKYLGGMLPRQSGVLLLLTTLEGTGDAFPPVDRTYASVQLTAPPGPSYFDSGPEPRPRGYVVFRIVTGVICTQSGRS